VEVHRPDAVDTPLPPEPDEDSEHD
jgi:hypothetical protein